ncbi:MAG: bifunctional D-altronate/D-mannonate dehydratase [Planctomycetaceae bacterium]|nr:bifunctional D-altronate/D-mannonate dehydratase [Planctomycetaceae bacterium]
MKIQEVRTIVTCPGRNFVLLKIITDEGVYGVGDGTLNGRELAVAKALEEHIAPLLIGRDPDQIEDTWQYLFRGTYWRGGPVLNSALAAVDLALWDIKGKRAGMPLYSLLGGKTRNGAVCYTHAHGESFEEVTDRAREFIDRGFKVVRCQSAIPGIANTYGTGKASGPHGESLPLVETWEPTPYLKTVPRLFEHLRNELGDEVELFHDVHERLTPIQAAQLAKALEPHRLIFLEDPLRPEHKESFRVIRQHSTTPIGMGELFTNKWECLPLITEQLIDYIRCDLAHIGGITEAKKIATVAECYHVQTAWHGPPDIAPITHAANVHLDLAIPNFGVQEWIEHPPEVAEVIPGGPTFEDGYLTVSDAPGLGCDINEDAAKKYPYQRGYLPTTRRADGAVHDW